MPRKIRPSLEIKPPFTKRFLSQPVVRYVLIVVAIVAAAYALFSYSTSRQGVLRKPDEARFTVVIDPNYPLADDDGTREFFDVTPVEVNWSVAERLYHLLDENPEIFPVLTRATMNEVVPAADRIQMAERADASIMVHIDIGTRLGRGFTVFYPDRTNDDEIRDQTKASDARARLARSSMAGDFIHDSLIRFIANILEDNGILPESERQSTAASRFSRVPTVTVELGHLTHQFDALYVSSELGRNRLAEAIADGVVKYLKEQEQEGS